MKAEQARKLLRQTPKSTRRKVSKYAESVIGAEKPKRKRNALKVAPNGEIYTSESSIQQACVRYFRAKYPHLAMLLFSIPNGAKMNKASAAIFVAEGLTKGVADLFLSIPAQGLDGRVHGLYIEMKTPDGNWSIDQKEFAKEVINQGYAYALCRSRSDFEKAVESYMHGLFIQSEHVPLSFMSKYLNYPE